LIEAHDPSRVELYGYSWAKDDGSPVRERLRRGFSRFIEIGGLSDDEAAARIEADRLDVLIDLSGHTHGARPGIVARRPAAVQASYFGYPGTTGARFCDYALVDEVVAPPGSEGEFSETLVRLAPCYWPHDQGQREEGPPPDRGALGLPNGVV